MKLFYTMILLMASGFAYAQPSSSADGVVAFGLLLFLAIGFCCLLLYFVPIAVAQYRKASNTTTVVLINIFLGWTIIGWIIALILAFAGDSGDQARRHRELVESIKQNRPPQ